MHALLGKDLLRAQGMLCWALCHPTTSQDSVFAVLQSGCWHGDTEVPGWHQGKVPTSLHSTFLAAVGQFSLLHKPTCSKRQRLSLSAHSCIFNKGHSALTGKSNQCQFIIY